ALMQLLPDTYTVETLSEKIGLSEKYVNAPLILTNFPDDAHLHCYTAKLRAAHPCEIARLQPNDQKRALQECFPQHRTVAAIAKDQKADVLYEGQYRKAQKKA